MQSLSWPGALAYRGFRRLALALVLSSFGDWLAFLATTALASQLVDSFGAKSFAVGGVLAFRLLPSVLLAPFVGVVADRRARGPVKKKAAPRKAAKKAPAKKSAKKPANTS